MDAMIAPTHVVATRRVRRAAAAPAEPTMTRQLPMRAAVGVRVQAPNWMWIVGGGVVGGLLLGPLGAIGGALAGALLVR